MTALYLLLACRAPVVAPSPPPEPSPTPPEGGSGTTAATGHTGGRVAVPLPERCRHPEGVEVEDFPFASVPRTVGARPLKGTVQLRLEEGSLSSALRLLGYVQTGFLSFDETPADHKIYEELVAFDGVDSCRLAVSVPSPSSSVVRRVYAGAVTHRLLGVEQVVEPREDDYEPGVFIYQSLSLEDHFGVDVADTYGTPYTVRAEGDELPAFEVPAMMIPSAPVGQTWPLITGLSTLPREEWVFRWTPSPVDDGPVRMLIHLDTGEIASCWVADDGEWVVPDMLLDLVDPSHGPASFQLDRIHDCAFEVGPDTWVQVQIHNGSRTIVRMAP